MLFDVSHNVVTAFSEDENMCRETTNCGKKNRNADKMHKNMQKSLAGCTKNEKTPAETISEKKFCRGYVEKYLPGFPGTADLYSF